MTVTSESDSHLSKGKNDAYNKILCLIPEEILAFLQSTQPKEVEKLEKQYGADTCGYVRIRADTPAKPVIVGLPG